MSRCHTGDCHHRSGDPDCDAEGCCYLGCTGIAREHHDTCEDHADAKPCIDGCERAGEDELNGRCAPCADAHAGAEA